MEEDKPVPVPLHCWVFGELWRGFERWELLRAGHQQLWNVSCVFQDKQLGSIPYILLKNIQNILGEESENSKADREGGVCPLFFRAWCFQTWYVMILFPRESRAEGRCRLGQFAVKKKVQNKIFASAGPGILYRLLVTVWGKFVAEGNCKFCCVRSEMCTRYSVPTINFRKQVFQSTSCVFSCIQYLFAMNLIETPGNGLWCFAT